MVPSTVTYNRLNTVKLPVLNHRAAEYQASSSKKSSVNVAYSDEMVWYPVTPGDASVGVEREWVVGRKKMTQEIN